MRNLITYEEISQLARPCTTDRDMAEAMIAEAQRVEVKPRLGDALYLRVIQESASNSSGEAETETETIYYGGTAFDDITTIISCEADADLIITGDAAQTGGRFGTLLYGGEWKTSRGESKLLTGLATALAYYTLARIVRDGNIQATTYGAAVKDDQHSADPERVERQRQYRELFQQADSYMAEALHYIKSNCAKFPEYTEGGKMRSNRTTIRIIGK